MHDEIWCDAAQPPVDLLWFEYPRSHRRVAVIHHGLESIAEVIEQRVVVALTYDPLRLTPLEIHEDPRVITPLGPGTRAAPIDVRRLQRRRAGGALANRHQSLADEPFVHAKSTIQALRPVIGHHQHRVIVSHEPKRLADLLIQ